MGMFPTKILVATDGTESAAPAIRVAAEMSAKTDSEIELIFNEDDLLELQRVLGHASSTAEWAEVGDIEGG